MRATRLFSDGEISKGLDALRSKGMGDLRDPRIIEQMKTKHPQRTMPLPNAAFTAPSTPHDFSEFGSYLAKLSHHVAAGPDGMLNEHLTCLARNTAPPEGKAAVESLKEFASLYANDKLPAWYVHALRSTRLVAIVKKAAAEENGVPSLRPVNIPGTLVKAIGGFLVTSAKANCAEICGPEQLGVAVRAGDVKLSVGLQMILDNHRDFVVVKLDIKHAHGSTEQAKTLRAFMSQPPGPVRDLASFIAMQYAAQSHVFVNGERLFDGIPGRGDFANGNQQGDPTAGICYCLTVNPANKAVSALLAPFGGGVKCIQDDTYIYGPPGAVFGSALPLYGEKIGYVGLEAQVSKSAFYGRPGIGDIEAAAAGIPRGRLEVRGAIYYGIDACGVPIGDEDYVKASLEVLADKAVGVITQTTVLLSQVCQHSSFTVIRLSHQHMSTHILRSIRPEIAHSYAESIDTAILHSVEAATSCTFPEGSIARRRLHLPVRDKGGGIRSAVETSKAAFIGGFCAAVNNFIDNKDKEGIVHKGLYHDSLVNVLGAGSFDYDSNSSAAGPFSHFLSGGSTMAQALEQAWFELRAMDPSHTVLAGEPTFCDQRTLTRTVDKAGVAALALVVNALPERDRTRVLFANIDSLSGVFLTTLPDSYGRLNSDQFRETFARYFLLPSPTIRALGLAGAPIRAGQNSRALKCDEFGDALSSLTRLPGGSFTRQHNNIQETCFALARKAGMPGTLEVTSLFRGALPLGQRNIFDENFGTRAEGFRSRKVPDFMLTHPPREGSSIHEDKLYEVKTTHYSGSDSAYYQNSTSRGTDRKDASIEPEYLRDLKRADAECFGTQDGTDGPLVSRLKAFGGINGIVVGHVNEGNKGIHELIGAIGRAAAFKDGNNLGLSAADTMQLIGPNSWFAKRVIGTTIARANAELLLSRLHFVGMKHTNSSSRRSEHSSMPNVAGFSAAAEAGRFAHQRGCRPTRRQ